VRKHHNGSRLIAGAIALLMTMPIGSLAWAQAQPAQGAAQPPSEQVPQPDEGGVNWAGVGYGTGALFSNVLYIPAKLVYAVLGGLVGGGAWALTGGNTQTANTIWRSSLGGDYVITPDMLEGKEQLHFSGPTSTAPEVTGVQPITPPAGAPSPAAATSSAPAPASGGAGGGGSMDRGAGPVGGSGGAPPPSSGGGLPDTSIE
jgi:hypothetical protein